MPETSTALSSRYLTASTRTLYEACHESGRDDGGKRCPSCCIRDLCEAHRRKPEPRDFPAV
jgi:hypothetical protein